MRYYHKYFVIKLTTQLVLVLVQSSVDLKHFTELWLETSVVLSIRNEASCPSSGTLNNLIIALASCGVCAIDMHISDNALVMLTANLCLSAVKEILPHLFTPANQVGITSLHNSFIIYVARLYIIQQF
jgi:hypothetical protein